jgi:hypothetical protein
VPSLTISVIVIVLVALGAWRLALGIGIGIGATGAVFSVANRLFLRPPARVANRTREIGFRRSGDLRAVDDPVLCTLMHRPDATDALDPTNEALNTNVERIPTKT